MIVKKLLIFRGTLILLIIYLTLIFSFFIFLFSFPQEEHPDPRGKNPGSNATRIHYGRGFMNYAPLAWLIAGLLIMGLEVIVPGFVLFWFGAGALVTALLSFLGILPSIFSQWIFFSISSLALLGLWQFYLKRFFKSQVVDDTRDPTLSNKMGAVSRRIAPNRPGEVELYDNFHGVRIWSAESDTVIEEGEEVQVVSANGIKLIVKKVK